MPATIDFEAISRATGYDAKLAILEAMNKNDIYDEDEPEVLLYEFSEFDDITEQEAQSIVSRLVAVLGRVILSREESCIRETPMLLGDCIDSVQSSHSSSWMLPPVMYNAMKNAFARASDDDADIRYILRMYNEHWPYNGLLGREYDIFYHPNPANERIYEELQAYLYHPDKIAKWLEDGHALEDYLN